MDPAGVSDEPATRSLAERSARDIRHRPHGANRPAAVHSRQTAVVTTLPAASRPTGEADRAAAVAEQADQRQADYFLRLLHQNRRMVEHRIEGLRKSITGAEASHNAEGASGLRRQARMEEQECEALTAMIEKLQRRFAAPGSAEVSRAGHGSWSARTAGR